MNRSLLQKLEEVLAEVDRAAADAYEHELPFLIDMVNEAMEQREDVSDLIGTNALEVMHTNHANHGNFIATQLRVRSARTLRDIAVWAYRSYMSRGFSPSYFPAVLTAWKEAVGKRLGAGTSNAAQVQAVYQVLLDSHHELLVESQVSTDPVRVEESLLPYFQNYLRSLVEPDSQSAIRISRSFIQTVRDIPVWWEQVICPTMYEIGRLWAEGELTVGQEHIATAITQRVMALFYPLILELPREKGSIVVTASPGELHEVGARMLADLLEMNGWDVYYTGANTPRDSILSLLEVQKARFLCISTTMPFNLGHVADIIRDVHAMNHNSSMQVLVGGQAYRSDREAWQAIGADMYFASASQAIYYLDSQMNGNGR
jgi:MerR family transcriptional regulator, light-induced transcriptional regulator